MRRAWTNVVVAAALALVVAACLVPVAGCGNKSQPQPEVVTEESSENMTVNAAQHFTVTLPSNQSTGYTWQLAQALDANLVKYVGKDYVEPADTSLDGAMGEEVWQFQALAEGSTTIVFQYSQAWDTETPPAKKHTVKLTISKNTNNMNQSFNIQAGQSFELSLDSNESTGYAWSITQPPDAKVLKQVSHQYQPSSNAAGAGGKEVWQFKGEAAGNTSMVLQYLKAGDTVPERTETVKVTVTKVTPPAPIPPKEYRDQKFPIDATVGEVFIIVLPVNATTGYQWQLLGAVDTKILALLGEEYRNDPASQVGGSGAYYYTFQAKGKGSTVLKFGLMPPAGDEPEDGANFTVHVK